MVEGTRQSGAGHAIGGHLDVVRCLVRRAGAHDVRHRPTEAEHGRPDPAGVVPDVFDDLHAGVRRQRAGKSTDRVGDADISRLQRRQSAQLHQLRLQPEFRHDRVHDAGERGLQSAADPRAVRVEERRGLCAGIGPLAKHADALQLQPVQRPGARIASRLADRTGAERRAAAAHQRPGFPDQLLRPRRDRANLHRRQPVPVSAGSARLGSRPGGHGNDPRHHHRQCRGQSRQNRHGVFGAVSARHAELSGGNVLVDLVLATRCKRQVEPAGDVHAVAIGRGCRHQPRAGGLFLLQ